ncbi:MAG: HNH endonuclease [Pseudomonadota bacterium]
MIERVLKLDVSGRPIRWISREAGALLYCREQVAWEAGESELVLFGGVSRQTGLRSQLRINSIIATKAIDRALVSSPGTPALTNVRLFRRDDYTCLYCGERFPSRLLTRDHVVPVSVGGADIWENVATACRACNQRKADRSLESLGWQLLALPYVPNRAEGLILENRTILADQMAFLRGYVGSDRRGRLN